ncbi:hypothetical protein LSTR_LSTR009403 [Laodelphax striatellus]|uniref:Dymeclin n=1 Tax=Laodelphax striatellus TaxID=195883 RepID=A0A482WHV4_LAOST|nr:hypothetical protein LSTR_LSTR009403 [Laodelphax striatellus]
MGISISHSDDLNSNELLQRFIGEEHIKADDPFWNSFLSFSLKPPATIEDDKNQETKFKSLYECLFTNNQKSGNVRSLLNVFLNRLSEKLVSSQTETDTFSWQLCTMLCSCPDVISNLLYKG